MCAIMDHKTSVLKQHLVSLGYNQDLPRDAVPLVDKILSDLVHTTKSLKHYKQLCEQLEKVRKFNKDCLKINVIINFGIKYRLSNKSCKLIQN